MPASPPPDPARRVRSLDDVAAIEDRAVELRLAGTGGEDRIVTVPNVITAVRLALLPVFVWLLLDQQDQGAAAWLLAGLGATDWVDGYIARRWNQVSTVGKILDPVADRLLFFVAIVAIIIDGAAPLWVCVAVLVREGLVAAATLILASLGAVRIDVTWFGKAGTFALMFAFPLFLAGASTMWWAEQAEVMAWLFVLPGLVLSYYAAAMYVPAGIRALRAGRAARAG